MTLPPNPGTEPTSLIVAVLLIDDDEEAAADLESILTQAGAAEFRIEWVAGPTDALARLADGGIDVVLLGNGEHWNEIGPTIEWIREARPEALILPLNEPPAARPMERAGRERTVANNQMARYWLPYALRYVTQRKSAEAALHAAEDILFEEKERAQVTLSSIGDAVLVTDLQGNVTYINPVAEALTGWRLAAAMGQPLAQVFDIIDGKTRDAAENPAEQAIREDRTVELESNCVLIRADGDESGIEDSAAPIHDRNGHVTGAVIVFRHVSQSRTVTRKMAHLARHDALTGLGNRLVLQERIDLAITQASQDGGQFGVIFVDVDDFKQINDSYGHLTGDRVLQGVAARLRHVLRSSDTACRVGGDEFVVLLPSVDNSAGTDRVLDKLRDAFREPIPAEPHALPVTVSIGVSHYPEDGQTIEGLLGRADTAMYAARGQSCRSAEE